MIMTIPCRRCRADFQAGVLPFWSRAFSLIEILVTVALLSVIILGLVAMFNQTRRAFTSSMTQVDVLESGRSAADLIARELEQMAPTFGNNVFNFYVDTPTAYTPLLQTLTDPNDPKDIKINNLQEVYFVTRNNQQWNCIGYRLNFSDYKAGIGTLYRYSSYNIPYTGYSTLVSNQGYFLATAPLTNNFSRMIDGVVDFRVRVYDGNGQLMQTTNANSLISANSISAITNAQSHELVVDYPQAVFRSNALPASVEVELGVLEDRTLARYKALSANPTAAYAYLTNHAGQVHIFRQRIPIRNLSSVASP